MEWGTWSATCDRFRDCCSKEQLSPYHTGKDFELQSLTLGEPMGSEGCVIHLPDPFVVMTSLMSKVQQSCASLSVSELIRVEPVATFGVARRILSVSHHSFDGSSVTGRNYLF